MQNYKVDNIVSILTEKALIQLNLMKLKISFFSKLQLNKINIINENLRKSLISQAKRYKRDISAGSKISREIDNVISAYIAELNHIGYMYDFAIAEQLSRISDIQSKIYNIDVNRFENKKMYNEITSQEKAKELYLKTEKVFCEEIISKCEDNIEYLLKEKDLMFDKINSSGRLEIESIKNNSFLFKMFENILNKIGGNKKFLDDAINPIKSRIKVITEEESLDIIKSINLKSIELCRNIDEELRKIPDKVLDNFKIDFVDFKYNFNIKKCELISGMYLVDKIKNFSEVGIVTAIVFGKNEERVFKKNVCDYVINITKEAHDSMIKKINVNNSLLINERNEIIEKVCINDYKTYAV